MSLYLRNFRAAAVIVAVENSQNNTTLKEFQIYFHLAMFA